MSYNGWTNYATWNVNLWIENDEPLYREKQRWLRCSDERIEASDVENFYFTEMGGMTPDFKLYGNDEPINFAEIAEHWETERQEIED